MSERGDESRAAQIGYEQAAIRSLCNEGALEAAIDAIRMLDVEAVIANVARERGRNHKTGVCYERYLGAIVA